MTSPPPVSPEMMELLERRLAESVGDRVERALKMRYAGIAAAVLAAVGFSGYSIVKAQITDLVSNVLEPVRIEAQRTIEQTKVQLESLQETKTKVSAVTEQVAEQIQDGARQLERFQAKLTKQEEEFDQVLTSVNDQLGTVVLRRRQLEADLAKSSTTLSGTLADTRTELTNLTQLVTALTRAAAAGGIDTAEAARLGDEAQAILTRLQSGEGGPQLATVFLQYGATMPSDVAHTIAERLKAGGYVVPTEDRMPNEAREVRFFDPRDQDAAGRLARDTMAALKEMGFGDVRIDVKDFTAYAKAKPRPGTLELWLALPPEAKQG